MQRDVHEIYHSDGEDDDCLVVLSIESIVGSIREFFRMLCSSESSISFCCKVLDIMSVAILQWLY